MISDKEVGKLWNIHQICIGYKGKSGKNICHVLPLIQKLVEERKKLYLNDPNYHPRAEDNEVVHIALIEALKDFGIPEYEWKNGDYEKARCK